jgi:hypothetical protein
MAMIEMVFERRIFIVFSLVEYGPGRLPGLASETFMLNSVPQFEINCEEIEEFSHRA